MESLPVLVKQQPPTWLKIVIISLLALGIFFRFAHLGQKVYWHDEAFTSLAISGYTLAEVKQEVFNHQGVIPITALDKYQHVNPERGVADTVRYLITSDPQHPPLYYVLARLWAQVVGDSPAQLRSLSACLSLLLFPCVYWLCMELFDAPIVGWVALGLIAVSPLEIFFAQEARQYGLWMVTISLSSAALLRAIRQDTRLNWLLYGLTLAIGLYTHLFTILVATAHGIYVIVSQLIVNQNFHWNKTLRSYLLSTAIAFLLFLPWLVVFIGNIHTALQFNTLWFESITGNLFERISVFLIRISRIFLDINLASDNWSANLNLEDSWLSTSLLLGLSLAFTVYLYYFWVYEERSTAGLFIVCLGIIPFLAFLLSDLFFGGSISLYSRYQLPLYLSFQISSAYVFAYHLFRENAEGRAIWKMVVSGFIIAGLVSDVSFSNAKSWWAQTRGSHFIKMAQTMNQSRHPLLVISESCNGNICVGVCLTLSHRLEPKSNLFTVPLKDETVRLPESDSDVFFVDRSSELLDQLKQDETYSLQEIDPSIGFWRIEKTPVSSAH